MDGTFEEFIYAVAHEMSHVRLITDGHALKESEVATDILVLVMGFESQYVDVQNALAFYEKLGYIDKALINVVIHEVLKRRQVIYLPAK